MISNICYDYYYYHNNYNKLTIIIIIGITGGVGNLYTPGPMDII